MMQHLTLDEVKARARDAYRERRLTAQHPDPVRRLCVYQWEEYRCAIGAALTDETMAYILANNHNHGVTVGSLVFRGVVTAEPGVIEIQKAYDSWCSCLWGEYLEILPDWDSVARDAELAFVQLIYS